MSRANPTTVERRQLEFTCPKCQANAGEWCQLHVHKTHPIVEIEFVGRMKNLHSARFAAATDAGRLPLTQGEI